MICSRDVGVQTPTSLGEALLGACTVFAPTNAVFDKLPVDPVASPPRPAGQTVLSGLSQSIGVIHVRDTVLTPPESRMPLTQGRPDFSVVDKIRQLSVLARRAGASSGLRNGCAQRTR